MKEKPILIRDIEKIYKLTFNVRPDMKLETYLKKTGAPNMSKALRLISNKIN